MRRRLPATVIVTLGLVLSSPRAAAQSSPEEHAAAPSDAEKQARAKARIDDARRAYQAGELAYQAGDFAAASENFSDAERLIPTPHAGYWLAMSLDRAGRIPEAIARFERLLADPNAGKIGPEKLEGARARLEELKKTPGKITLSTRPEGATVTVDGEKHAGVTPVLLELNPGRHKLSFALQGHDGLEVELDVPAGSKGAHTLDLPESVVPAPLPPKKARRLTATPRGHDVAITKPPSTTGAWIVAGAAGAATVAGGIFGVMALSAKSKYDGAPSDDHADDVARNSMLADICFGSALTLGLASLVMFTTSDGNELPTSSGRIRPVRHLAVTPLLSPQGGGARAGFAF